MNTHRNIGHYTESGYYREEAPDPKSKLQKPADPFLSSDCDNGGPVIAAICFLCGLVGAVWFIFFAMGALVADRL